MNLGKVKFSFKAIEIDELSVIDGEVVELLFLNSDGWWMIRNNGSIGLIPGNYVELVDDVVEPPSPDFDELSRIKAQRQQAEDKIKIIRNCLQVESKNSALHDYNPDRLAPMNSVSKPSLRPSTNSPDKNKIVNGNRRQSLAPLKPKPIITHNDREYAQNPSVHRERSSSVTQGRGVEAVQGIRYPQCRSIVYGPSALKSPKNRLNPQLSFSLSLDHIYGYNCLQSRYLNNVMFNVGKSMVVSIQGHILYSAATLVVISKPTSTKQKFFTEHTAPVTCLAMHPTGLFVASGQVDYGAGSLVLVWSLNTVISSKSKKFSTVRLIASSSGPDEKSKVAGAKLKGDLKCGILSLEFSIDGRLLLVIDASQNMSVFDWAIGIELHKIKLGHVINDIKINPISYYLMNNSDKKSEDPVISCCYTLCSIGEKTIKFWSLICTTQSNRTSPSRVHGVGRKPSIASSSKDGNGKESAAQISLKTKESWEFKCSHGVVPKSHGLENSEFISLEFIKNITGNNQASYVAASTSMGSVFVWEQLPVDDKQKIWTSWTTRSRLVSVVLDMHSCPITKILCINPGNSGDILLTSSTDGEINVWNVEQSNSHPSISLVRSNLPTISIPINKSDPSLSNISSVSVSESNSSSIESSLLNTDSEGSQSIVQVIEKDFNNTLPDQVNELAWDEASQTILIGTSHSSIFSVSGKNFINGDKTSIEVTQILSGHFSSVNYVNTLPREFSHLALSVSSIDRTVRIWDTDKHCQISQIVIQDCIPTCAVFVPSTLDVSTLPNGQSLASWNMIIGDESGEIILLAANIPFDAGDSNKLIPSSPHSQFKILAKKKVSSKGSRFSASQITLPPIDGNSLVQPMKHLPTSSSSCGPSHQVTIMKFSADGDLFAVVCRNENVISIMSTRNQYRRLSLCRGHHHTSEIKSFDFSSDGKFIQANDSSHEVLYWEVSSGKIIPDGYSLRDIEWATWTCSYGWPVQGVIQSSNESEVIGKKHHGGHINSDVAEVDCVSRFHGNLLVAVCNSNVDSSHQSSFIKLSNYPCLPNTPFKTYRCHIPTSSICTIDEENADFITVLTSGHNDSCIFQWKVVDEKEK